MGSQRNKALEDLSYAQKERLAFIDFCLQYFGDIARTDLIQHFKTGLASCSRDFTLYRELMPDNLVLKHEDKRYYRTEQFQPLFEHNSSAILQRLVEGFGDGISMPVKPSDVCIQSFSQLNPNSDIVAGLMRGIVHQQPIQVTYWSLSSGETQRIIVPHTLVNNGQRWHVRAFDRKHNQFRDFVCTRFTQVDNLEEQVSQSELRESDDSWNQSVELELVPHPSQSSHQAIALDFSMESSPDWHRSIKLRLPLASYYLRYWNVDCTEDHSLTGREHLLWLRNASQLKDIAELDIAPKA
ncbi:WYL domain-containing protein [Vibrio parahaemolyticus]|uniref:WYL domain-containing protein n=2 Tax=Vibrionaceae TaxID=641 RepID=UPI00215CA7F0|nr:WYL domain-containing protein [Vibrio parahaemolyticus]MCR9766813.1 WYL domain-containing protein [Vibrio parahaemolyticus]MDF5672329.1 WYL domain-containing protein [Vibrio parahaemolyticus]MDG2732196.1 WYL domain-containing protein [Vibrio parahaemolyticus]